MLDSLMRWWDKFGFLVISVQLGQSLCLFLQAL